MSKVVQKGKVFKLLASQADKAGMTHAQFYH
jgi:hypothetical protein